MLVEPKRVPEFSNQATAGVKAAPTVVKFVVRIATILGVSPEPEGERARFDEKVLASY
jgi:hypothetical protein